jgi:hypothetical protein
MTRISLIVDDYWPGLYICISGNRAAVAVWPLS